jgi:titin
MFSGPPSAPVNLRVMEVYKDFVVVSWEPPLSNGGEKILGYDIEKSIKGCMFVNAGYTKSVDTRFKVTRLHEGKEYIIKVSAENRIGMGAAAKTESILVKIPFGEKMDL